MNEKLLKAHNKFVRVNGVTYRIISARLGDKILCDAESIGQGDRINLVKTRSRLGIEIRFHINLGLFR